MMKMICRDDVLISVKTINVSGAVRRDIRWSSEHHKSFGKEERFWIDDGGGGSSAYLYHRDNGKPSHYCYYGKIIHFMRWHKDGVLIKEHHLYDILGHNLCGDNEFLDEVDRKIDKFFALYPKLTQWNRWTSTERAFFKLFCL